jgi:hypothetical protein
MDERHRSRFRSDFVSRDHEESVTIMLVIIVLIRFLLFDANSVHPLEFINFFDITDLF